MKHIWTRLGAAVLCAGLLLGMLPMPAAAKGSSSISPDAARAMAQVLQEQLGLYGQGALEEGPSVWAKNDGLLYAEAADFDLDGSTELILTRVDDSCPTLEVYRASGSGCQQIHSQKFWVGGSFDVYHVGLHRTADGRTYLYETWWTMREGRETTDLTHWTLDGTPAAVDGYETELALFGYNTGYLEAQVVEVASVVADLNRIADGGTVSAASALQQLPYVGDRSLCQMDAKMARAYAQVLERLYREDPRTRAMLVDYAGDGLPLLLTCAERQDVGTVDDFAIWTWDGTEASEYPFQQDSAMGVCTAYDFGAYNGRPALKVADGYYMGDPTMLGDLYYEISGGQLHLRSHVLICYAWSSDGDLFTAQSLPLVEGEVDENGNETATAQMLQTAGWVVTPPYYASLLMENGQRVPTATADEFSDELIRRNEAFTRDMEDMPFESMDGSVWLNGDWPAGDRVAALLTDYASAGPAYDYPVVTEDDDAYVRAVADAVAAAVGGEITAIYKLSDGVYYVLITVDGGVKGALVQGVRQNGRVVWNVTETHDTPLEPEALDKLAGGLLSGSNITVDYGQIGGGLEELKTYLQGVLDNMDGLTPNDAAKQELAGWVESALSAGCSGSAAGKDNRLTLGSDQLGDLADQAREMRRELEQLLGDNGVTLNRPLVIRIRILWSNLDWGAPCQFTLDQALLEAMDGCTLQLLLGDGQHGLMLSPEAVKALVERYGSLAVRIAAAEDGTYTIQFLDAQGDILERLETAVTVFLPCESPTATVMATYGGGSDNWGGQYDQRTGVISFDVRYSGDYQVLENSARIDDIAELPEENQQAIRFMVSKGYFSLEDGKFLPREPLNRYAFSEALVGMFFALDRDAQTAFTDVPADSPYYPYVASGEQSRILEGFDDGTFRGENELTVEQMLALAARTLIEQKGYAAPADPETYLGGFSDGLATSDWAVEQVALSIREGLMDPGGELHPQEPVTRAQAAQILYRLFLLLHEVSPVALDLPPVTETDAAAPVEEPEAAPEDKGIPAAVPVAAAAVAAAGGAVVWYWLRKRKH